MSEETSEPPQFEGKIKRWGMSYLRHNHWKFASVCGREDLESEAHWIYWRVRQQHPGIVDEEEFLRLYKTGLRFRVKKQAAASFPNPYNFSQQNSCVSLTAKDGSDLTNKLASLVYSPIRELEECIDLLKIVPKELRGVSCALVREVLGLEEVPTRTRTKLRGRASKEPINWALARLFGFSRERDLVSEVGRAMSSKLGRKTVPVEQEILEAVNITRKKKEKESDLLSRVVLAVDKMADEKFYQMSEEAQDWCEEAVKAVADEEAIPPFPAEDSDDGGDDSSDDDDDDDGDDDDDDDDSDDSSDDDDDDGDDDDDDDSDDSSDDDDSDDSSGDDDSDDSSDDDDDDDSSDDDGEDDDSSEDDDDGGTEEDEGEKQKPAKRRRLKGKEKQKMATKEKDAKKSKAKTAKGKKDKKEKSTAVEEKTKKSKKDKLSKNGKEKKSPGRQGAIDRSSKITVLSKKNPYKEGTIVYDLFKACKTGMTVDAFIKKGAKLRHVKKAIEKGHIKVG